MSKVLKDILGDGYTDEIAAKFEKYDVSVKGEMIPKVKFDEVSNQKKELKGQVDTLNETLIENNKSIDAFKEAAAGNDVLEAKIQEYQDKMKSTQENFDNTLATKEEEWAKRDLDNRKAFAVREGLLVENADPAYMDLLMKEIDLDKITESDGKFNGVNDLIGGVKTNFEKLFGKVVVEGTGIDNGDSDNPILTAEQEAAMSDAEFFKQRG